MNRRDQVALVLLVLAGVAAGIAVVALASQLCPGPSPGDPCPEAGRNQALVIGLAGLAVFLLLTPVAFVLEYALQRRIAYIGAWSRAARRGALAAVALAAIAGLRVLDGLNPFSAAVVVGMAVAAEWLAIRRLDGG